MLLENFYVGRKVKIKDSGTPRVYEIAGRMPDGKYVLSDPHDHCVLTERSGIKGFAADRLELLPPERSRPGSEADKRQSAYVGGSAIHCTSDEAVEWLTFVMLQAASLFERIPSPLADGENMVFDGDRSRAEIERLILARGESPTGPVMAGALAFYDASLKWYQDDAQRYGD